jgi:hypothetical protein
MLSWVPQNRLLARAAHYSCVEIGGLLSRDREGAVLLIKPLFSLSKNISRDKLKHVPRTAQKMLKQIGQAASMR